MREKLRFTMLDNTTYSGKTYQPCGFHTARRLATSSQVRQFGARLIDPGYYATKRHKEWLKRNVRLLWKCTIVAVRFSTLCRDEDLWRRGLIFHSELKSCPLGCSSHRLPWYNLLGLVLLGLWIEELRIHPQVRQVAETQKLLVEPFLRYNRRLDVLSRSLPGYRPWLRYGLLGMLLWAQDDDAIFAVPSYRTR